MHALWSIHYHVSSIVAIGSITISCAAICDV